MCMQHELSTTCVVHLVLDAKRTNNNDDKNNINNMLLTHCVGRPSRGVTAEFSCGFPRSQVCGPVYAPAAVSASTRRRASRAPGCPGRIWRPLQAAVACRLSSSSSRPPYTSSGRSLICGYVRGMCGTGRWLVTNSSTVLHIICV